MELERSISCIYWYAWIQHIVENEFLNNFLYSFQKAILTFLIGFVDTAGLHLGAETAPEIALSILSEILSVIREVNAEPLHLKSGKIHE